MSIAKEGLFICPLREAHHKPRNGDDNIPKSSFEIGSLLSLPVFLRLKQNNALIIKITIRGFFRLLSRIRWSCGKPFVPIACYQGATIIIIMRPKASLTD